MPEDIPPSDRAPEETTTTEEEIIEEVVEEEVEAQLSEVCAEMLARIDMLEARVNELHERTNGHNTTPDTPGENEPTPPSNGNERREDEQPTPTHFYFRRLGE
jgi:hypothetical protein